MAWPVLVALIGCGGGGTPLTPEELLSPEACAECHPDHYRQWQGSSHAFAADDPVFLAANARFQRDDGGAHPGDCIRCHAPVALARGATSDGLDLPDLGAELRGVTCYACHAVISANAATHEMEMAAAEDADMAGGIDSPKGTAAHGSVYSQLFDREQWRSTDLCGVCHDFDSRSGAHVHRTYTEWTESLFADTFSRSFLTCSGCHMTGRTQEVATDGPVRRLHDHTFPGVGVALEPWPEQEALTAAVQGDLSPTVRTKVCLTNELRPEVTLDNVMGGHMWPSGDTATRATWVELLAYDGDTLVYQSGQFADGAAVTADADPDVWLLRDQLADGNGDPVPFFWQATTVDPVLLPPAVTSDPLDPRYFHAVTKTYPALAQVPDRMTVRVLITPIGLDVADELIAGGDLDPAVRDRIPVFTLGGSVVEWTGEPGSCVPQ